MQYFCASRRCRVFANWLIDASRSAFGFSWPGIRPGRRVTFIFRKMKVTKAKAPHRQRPCASLRATCGARSWAARQNSFRATRSSQTAAASQSTKFGRSSATKRNPCPVLLGAGRRGLDSRTSNGLLESCFLNSILVFWSLARAQCARAAIKFIEK